MVFGEKRLLLFYFIFFLLAAIIFSQPRAKYRPFDWLLFKESGKINSLSEGFEYLYIATSTGGISRYSLYSNQYDFPITTAQGLASNNVNSVHFDHNTGILWASSPGVIQYSYTREGNWRHIDFIDIGLTIKDRIIMIGNSDNYIWARANTVYVKMDKSSGILAGIYPMPDEINIKWSSGQYLNNNKIADILNNYTIMSGWMVSGSQFIDNYGRYIDITSGLIGANNDVWIGSSDGTLFHGNKTMEAIYPTEFGIRGSNINALLVNNDNVWIGSKNYNIGRGVTRLNTNNFQADHYDFDITVNMSLTEVHSFYHFENNLWVGGNGVVLTFDKDENYWRTLGEDRGIPNGDLTSMVGDSNYVWLGSYYGIRQIDRKTKREEQMGFEYLFYNHPVYDLAINDFGVWIASRTGIYLYDKNNPQIMNALSIGDSYLDFPVSRVTSICQDKNVIYFATNIGVVTFDLEVQVWDLLISVAEYRDNVVSDMIVIGKFCFIGTEQGLFRVNMKSHRVREYDFDFIGSINALEHIDKYIWIGSSEGLIRFKWRKDI
jgi:ligand-binding sensor domain-containing protein